MVKYGQNSSKKERLIIETMSDTLVIKELLERIADLGANGWSKTGRVRVL